MKNDISKSALLIIDMEKGFIDRRSPFCIKGAQETVPRLSRLADSCRRAGLPVFMIRRVYRSDGTDVERARLKYLEAAGRPCSDAAEEYLGYDFVEGLEAAEGDYVINKPRYSAFFATTLDMLLRRLDVDTVIVTGTTTPNCVRATCYDADSLDYGVIVPEDCTSSNTPETQQANIDDLRRIGLEITTAEELIAEIDRL